MLLNLALFSANYPKLSLPFVRNINGKHYDFPLFNDGLDCSLGKSKQTLLAGIEPVISVFQWSVNGDATG